MNKQRLDSSGYNYLNEAVNNVFFDGRFEGVPVYLDYEDEIREEFAEKVGLSPSELDQYLGMVIAETLDWCEKDIYIHHKRALVEWHRNDFSSPPPFSALLLGLSLAAENMRGDAQYSQNNYYQRLLEVLQLSGDKLDTLRSAGKHTELYWKALNLWLTENDYAYGRPTARQVNSWKYVSYAISQSLIREGDRYKFHDLFVRYGLSPYESLDEQQMVLYLHDWVARYCNSKWIKRLWENPGLHERVAGAALDELEIWGEATPSKQRGQKQLKRLEWLLVTKSFPRLQVNLYLCANGTNPNDAGSLQLSEEDSVGLSGAAFKDTDSIWLSPLEGTTLAYLAPVASIKIDALLQAKVGLLSNTLETSFSHSPRPIIPLVKMEGMAYYREVSRISMHLVHAVLCHDSWIDSVTKHLDQYARKGFKIIKGPSGGVPPQWNLITGVQVVVAILLDTVNDNLQSLVPYNEGVSLKLFGGLKLASGIWHASAPPEVIASNEDGLLDVSLLRPDVGKKDKVLHEEPAKAYNPSFLSSLSNQYAGSYSLAASKGRLKKEVQVAFRSALTPRKQAPNQAIELAYPLGPAVKGFGLFSASLGSDLDGATSSLQGMVLTGGQNMVIQSLDEGWKGWSLGAGTETTESQWQHYDTEQVAVQAESCILRGYHIWHCEPQGPQGEEAPRVMRCKDCNAVNVAPKPKRGWRRRAKTGEAQQAPVTSFTIAEGEKSPIDADLVYDALCYMGSSKWRSLESVLSTHVELPWQVAEFARNLVDLGLLDASLDGYGGKPIKWSCPPPALVISEFNRLAYLTGFRNQKLVEAVTQAMDRVGNNISDPCSFMVPTYHGWKVDPMAENDIRAALAGITDPVGRPIIVKRCAARAIVGGLPAVRDVTPDLPEITVDASSEVENFNLHSGRWRRGTVDSAGAYRTVFAGRRYFYHDQEGRSRQGSPELVKLLSARSARTLLHAYREDKNQFEAVIGSPPPGLYRRALVSLVGKLPTLEEGKHIYKGIPPQVAEPLLAKLYG